MLAFEKLLARVALLGYLYLVNSSPYIPTESHWRLLNEVPNLDLDSRNLNGPKHSAIARDHLLVFFCPLGACLVS